MILVLKLVIIINIIKEINVINELIIRLPCDDIASESIPPFIKTVLSIIKINSENIIIN